MALLRSVGMIAALVLAAPVVRAQAGAQPPAQQPAPEPAQSQTGDNELEEVTTEPPPKDAWHIRFNAGAAYERTRVRYDLGGEKQELNSTGAAVLIQLGIGAKLGRDIFIGVIGGLFYVPRSHVDGEWTDNSVTMLTSSVFLDHRLPFERTIHLGAMLGPGFINTFGPEEERMSGWGPVGGIFLGFEGPQNGSVRSGLMLQVIGGAMSNSHAVAGERTDFDTFVFGLGGVYTLRFADPHFPRTFPSLAER